MLGQGYSPAANSGSQHKNKCLAETNSLEKELGPLNIVEHADGSFAETKEKAMRDIEVNLRADLALGAFSTEIDGHFEKVFIQEGHQAAATLTIYMETLWRNADENEIFDNNNYCTGDSETSVSDSGWVDRCGTRFVSGEKMGAVLILTWGFTDFTEEEMTEIKGAINAGYLGQEVSLEATLKELNTIHETTTEFSYLNLGFPALPGSGDLKYDEVTAHLEKFKDQAIVAYDGGRGDIDDPAYGAIIERDFSTYSTSYYEACTGRDWPEHLQCFREFDTNNGWKPWLYRKWRDELQHAVDNPNEYFWGANLSDNQNDYEEAADFITVCLDAHEAQRQMCMEMMQGGVYEEVCENCPYEQEVDDCDYQTIWARYNGVPDMVVHKDDRNPDDPDPHRTYAGSPVTLSEVSNGVCGLSSFGGHFAGGGEAVKLSAEPGGNNTAYWTLDVDSQRSETSERVHGTARCTEVSNFFDNDGNDWHTGSTVSVSTNSSQTVGVDDTTFAAGFGGISGKMQGGGERAYVDQIQDPTQLTAASQQGTLSSWATSFGLMNPHEDMPEWSGTIEHELSSAGGDTTAYTKKKQLPRADTTFCFITEINGDFDGAGEHVDLVIHHDHWGLRAAAACKETSGWFGTGKCEQRKKVQVKASCYAYDQSEP